MPVKSCTEGGKPGYKYGDNGKCYTFQCGNLAEEKAAYDKAVEQGKAIEKSKGNW